MRRTQRNKGGGPWGLKNKRPSGKKSRHWFDCWTGWDLWERGELWRVYCTGGLVGKLGRTNWWTGSNVESCERGEFAELVDSPTEWGKRGKKEMVDCGGKRMENSAQVDLWARKGKSISGSQSDLESRWK